jgi:hypothetical protein
VRGVAFTHLVEGNVHTNALKCDAAVYTTRVRIPGYTAAVSVRGSLTPSHGARILGRLVRLSREEHRALAIAHGIRGVAHGRRWGAALNAAGLKTFGRPFLIGDYRISCIGLEEFGDREKKLARRHGLARSSHLRIAYAHAWAVGWKHFERFVRELRQVDR